MPAQSPFDPGQYLRSPRQEGSYRLLSQPIGSLPCIGKLERYFGRARTRSSETGRPFNRALHQEMSITTKLDLDELEHIPITGPAAIVSKHPPPTIAIDPPPRTCSGCATASPCQT